MRLLNKLFRRQSEMDYLLCHGMKIGKNCHIYSAIHGRASGASGFRALSRQRQARKRLHIRMGKGQSSARSQIQPGRRTILPFRIGHCQLDRQPHIRRAKLRQYRTIPVFHQRMDNTLPMDYHIHLLQRKTIQTHRLNYLQTFIYHCS